MRSPLTKIGKTYRLILSKSLYSEKSLAEAGQHLKGRVTLKNLKGGRCIVEFKGGSLTSVLEYCNLTLSLNR